LAQVEDEIPHKLVIAGEERCRAKEDLELIEQLGINDRIHFTGWVSHDHLPAFYNLADLFVLPSLHEGFGIPLLEAMTCGCPVLTSTTGSPPEVVEDAGYLVDPIKVDDNPLQPTRLLSLAQHQANQQSANSLGDSQGL
jgi:glycosyltransferase involved in cell wall biosynthesis